MHKKVGVKMIKITRPAHDCMDEDNVINLAKGVSYPCDICKLIRG